MAFVDVEGTVGTVFRNGNGFALWESWSSERGEGKRRWAVWTGDVSVAEGDRVKVRGVLGTKVGEFEGRDGVKHVSVDHNVNKATVQLSEKAQGGAGGTFTQSAGADEGWPVTAPQNGSQGYNEEVPF